MKILKSYNFFHTNFIEQLGDILSAARKGTLKEKDIQIVRFDGESCPFGIKTPLEKMAAGYDQDKYEEMVNDYLKLMILCGFRENGDLFEMVKATHEDDQGCLIVEGCYTNDPQEEFTNIATVFPNGRVENQFGDPVDTIFQFGKANTVVADAVARQEQRKAELIEIIHDDVVKQVNEGDTTVLEEMLKFIPHKNLLGSLSESGQLNHKCKASV